MFKNVLNFNCNYNMKLFVEIHEKTDLPSELNYHACNAIVKSTSSELFETLYECKLRNPQFYVLWEITSSYLCNIGIFETIKTATNYGIDGFLFSYIETTHMLEVKKLRDCLQQLPTPYNFNWEIYIVGYQTSDVFTIDTVEQVGKIVPLSEFKKCNRNHIEYPTSPILNKKKSVPISISLSIEMY